VLINKFLGVAIKRASFLSLLSGAAVYHFLNKDKSFMAVDMTEEEDKT
jgi:hypothetical protein